MHRRGFFGESLVDAAQAIGGASESSVSASAGQPQGRHKVAATRTKQTNFSAYEDNVLCKSWLEISCDAATNTGQRKEAFWGRVVSRYNSQCRDYPERTLKSITSRWDHIKADHACLSDNTYHRKFRPRENSDQEKISHDQLAQAK
jgi:hypothetical protein